MIVLVYNIYKLLGTFLYNLPAHKLRHSSLIISKSSFNNTIQPKDEIIKEPSNIAKLEEQKLNGEQ